MANILYLIRHGQASFLAENYDQLSPRGEAQARSLGIWWQEKLQVDAVFHGTLQRQRDTWEIAANSLQTRPPVQVLAGLNEHEGTEVMTYHQQQNPDRFPKPTNKREALRQFFKLNLAWAEGEIESGPHESWADFQQRVRGTFQEILAQDQHERIAVISSGGVIATALSVALGVSNQKIMELNWQIRNTSLTVLHYSKGKLFLRDFNWVPHLTEEEISYV